MLGLAAAAPRADSADTALREEEALPRPLSLAAPLQAAPLQEALQKALEKALEKALQKALEKALEKALQKAPRLVALLLTSLLLKWPLHATALALSDAVQG